MKILTLNTWGKCGPWKERWEVIFAGLKIHKPDVIGFQEIPDQEWAAEIQKKSGYPHLIFPSGIQGLAFLSRYAPENMQWMTMKTQSPTEDYFRYALRMDVTIEGRKMAFFDTHLSWKLPEGAVREKQVGELLQFIQNAGDLPSFMVGDFNAPPETPEIKKMAQAGFEDTFSLKHPGEAGLTWDNANPYAASASARLPDRRIDYIFMRVTGTKVPVTLACVQSVERVYTEPADGIFASDHYGVLAQLT